MTETSQLNAQISDLLMDMSAELKKIEHGHRALPHNAQVSLARAWEELERAAVAIATHRVVIDGSGPCLPIVGPMKH